MNLEDELRAALSADADAVTRADLALEYPGDPAPRQRRFPRAATVLAAAAATVALVGGVVWGSGTSGGKVQPATRHSFAPRHPQVHTVKDVPAAVALLPKIAVGLEALQPVEEEKVSACLRALGYPAAQHGGDRLTVVDRTVPAQARARGYDMEPIVRAQRRDAELHRQVEARGSAAVEGYTDAQYGPPDEELWVHYELVGSVGASLRYGGCTAEARQSMYAGAELARLKVEDVNLPSGVEAAADVGGAAVVAARERWRACLATTEAPRIIGRTQDLVGMPTSWRVAGTDVEGWVSATTQRLVDLQPLRSEVLSSVLKDEKRLAVLDGQCQLSSGLRSALRASGEASPSRPAALLAGDPALLDDVFDLDAAITRLRLEYGR